MIESIQHMRCDSCGEIGQVILEAEELQTLMEMSREDGWVLTDRGDFCPSCYKKGVLKEEMFKDAKVVIV